MKSSQRMLTNLRDAFDKGVPGMQINLTLNIKSVSGVTEFECGITHSNYIGSHTHCVLAGGKHSSLEGALDEAIQDMRLKISNLANTTNYVDTRQICNKILSNL